MIGITKQCENPDLAWEVLKFTYFDRPGLVNRYETTRIIPPLKAAWDAPIFKEPDVYLGGQPLGELFIDLAPDMPPRYQNPYWSEGARPAQRCDFRRRHRETDTQRGFNRFGGEGTSTYG